MTAGQAREAACWCPGWWTGLDHMQACKAARAAGPSREALEALAARWVDKAIRLDGTAEFEDTHRQNQMQGQAVGRWEAAEELRALLTEGGEQR